MGATSLGNDVEAQADREKLVPHHAEGAGVRIAPSAPARGQAFLATIFYLVCSSTMLLVNKGAVHFFPYANCVLLLQASASCALLLLARSAGRISFDGFQPTKGRRWTGVMLAWLAPMLFNMKCLQYLNVETVIVFRTLSTFAVAAGDAFFFGKSFSIRAKVAMGIIVSGSLLYAANDLNLSFLGYLWATLYFLATVINALYIKYVFNSLPSMSNWEKTYYNNLLSLPILLGLAISVEPVSNAMADLLDLKLAGLLVLALSCVMGLAIGVAGTLCRDLLSATAFNIAGNMNKFVTIILSAVFFSSRNTASAMFGLVLSLCGGALYAFS